MSQISLLLLSLITDFFGFLLFFSLLSHTKKTILLHCFAIKDSMFNGDCLSLNNDNGNASLSRYVMLCHASNSFDIPIRGSFARRKISLCFKGFYSLVLQIIAGVDYQSLASTMGHARNTHESTIMKNHSFWKNREGIFHLNQELLKG